MRIGSIESLAEHKKTNTDGEFVRSRPVTNSGIPDQPLSTVDGISATAMNIPMYTIPGLPVVVLARILQIRLQVALSEAPQRAGS